MQSQLASVPILYYVQITLSALNLIAVLFGLSIAYRQLTKAHDWNRRKASHDLLIQFASGDIRNLRARLETEFGALIFDQTQTYSDVVTNAPKETEKSDIRYMTRTVLNYFESMAVGIKNGVLEDDICFDYTSEAVSAYWRWSQPLVREVRPVAPLAWIELEGLTERWGPRYSSRLLKQKEALRLPARPKT